MSLGPNGREGRLGVGGQKPSARMPRIVPRVNYKEFPIFGVAELRPQRT